MLILRARPWSGARVVWALASVAVLAAPVAAQRQFCELRKQHLPVSNDHTSAVALGDVDGDGDPDLVVGNGISQQNRLHLNDGAGVFVEATATRMPTDADETAATALADVDGDGDLDLILGNGDFQQNRLYLNDGTGTYADATAARLPPDADDTAAVAVGDVDADGDLDLVFANGAFAFGTQNRLYLNDGTGTFTDATAAQLPADFNVTLGVVLGDVDADGDPDLVLANTGLASSTRQNRLYLNDGAGVFTDATAARLPTVLDDSAAVALADVDLDGDPDLVFANGAFDLGSQNRLCLNDGAGNFSEATATRMPTDLDDSTAVVVADVDSDGDPDLVFANGWSSRQRNRLYRNDGTGTFGDATAAGMPAVVAESLAVASADVDRDGDPDLVLGNGNLGCGGQNRLHMNDGAGAFADASAARMPAVLAVTYAVAMGDVDGDGDPDTAFANGTLGGGGQNGLFLNDGRGTFTDATAARMPVDGDESHAVALVDVDRDGDLDLIFGNGAIRREQNRLYLNDGTGTFVDATAARLPIGSGETFAVVPVDVDRDGDPDLILGNNGRNGLYLNDGAGVLVDATAARLPTAADDTRAVASADVDLDGDPDLVFANGGVAALPNRLYLNDGTGIFTDATALRLPAVSDNSLALALADVDLDGDPDLVVANFGQDRLYLNDGAGTFVDATASRMPTDNHFSSAVAVGDVDLDGDPDLVLSNSGPNRLYLNDGTGRFLDVTGLRMPTRWDETSSVALGDVDLDGDPDLIAGSDSFLEPNRLDSNLLRQLEVPLLARVGREYRLEAYSRYGPARLLDLVFPFVAADVARIPIPPFGVFGLDPATTIGLAPLVILPPPGVARLALTLPGEASLVGVPIYAQALLLRHPVSIDLSNVTADVFRR